MKNRKLPKGQLTNRTIEMSDQKVIFVRAQREGKLIQDIRKKLEVMTQVTDRDLKVRVR